VAKSGWKNLPAAKSNEQAIARLSKASMLLSEALSNVNTVLKTSSFAVDVKYYNAAAKMYKEIHDAERTYHNYLVGQPLDRKVGE
jgi:enamine deaminase RidA (YjgF/YER057c/UK114 family)